MLLKLVDCRELSPSSQACGQKPSCPAPSQNLFAHHTLNYLTAHPVKMTAFILVYLLYITLHFRCYMPSIEQHNLSNL